MTTSPVLDLGTVARPPVADRAAPRGDIQALRALAVTLVVVYHLWPAVVRGGFVGVDVFFAISGFLITSHLIAKPPRSVQDLASFWSRRVKRLLPASLAVLMATLIASRVIAPETQWANTARQAGAASVYVVNWLLAGDSIDYLAAENAPTPVQHFWSLSVEEQFYFVWPILVGALAWFAARRGAPRLVAGSLALIAATSLGYSIIATATNPSAAYFVTPTRVWEFALGGALACIVKGPDPEDSRSRRSWRLTRRGRVVLAVVGLLAIGFASSAYDGSTPFPSWTALVPVLGVLAVLAAGVTSQDGLLGRAFESRAVRWLGDTSYSVYLWHWPLIVLVPYVTGGLGMVDRFAVIALTLGLAAFTKRFIEDRYRFSRVSPRRVFGVAALGMVAVLVLSAAQLAEVRHRDTSASSALEQAQRSNDPCLGAGALISRNQCEGRSYDRVLPSPAQAPDDKSAAYEDVGGRDCWSTGPDFAVVTCTFGKAGGDRRIALVGNSHAGQWLPTLERLSRDRSMEVTTYLASRCAFSAVDQDLPTAAQTAGCRDWVNSVISAVEDGDFDAVVVTNRMSVRAAGSDDDQASESAYGDGYAAVLSQLKEAKVPVLVIRDTPAPGDGGVRSVPDCVAEHARDLGACAGQRSLWEPPEPLEEAFARVQPTGAYVDLNDGICGPDTCAAVVGGVIVYSDGSHLTATYARTLWPLLKGPLDEVMQR